MDDLRLADVRTLLAAHRVGSVTAAARELEVTPSQVSKAIMRLERHLGSVLVARSAKGVTLTAEGRRALPELEEIASRLGRLRRKGESLGADLTFAAASYQVACFLPRLAPMLPGARLRGIEMPPALVRAHLADNVFDMAVLGDKAPRLPSTWASDAVGTVRKGLFASPSVAHALGKGPVASRDLQDIPFVTPMYNVAGRFALADDDCPLPVTSRRIGHESQTIAVALEIAARTDQLVFGPVIAAASHVAAGALVEVRVKGWHVSEPLILAFATDRVRMRAQKAAVSTVRRVLAELQPGGA